MLIVISLLLSGILFTAICFRMLYRRRILIAGFNATAGIALLSASIVLSLVLFNIHTYRELTREIDIARVTISKQKGEVASLLLNTFGKQEEFLINSEEWQLDARFLKWKPWAYLFGKEPVVRLERLSSRTRQKNNVPPTMYDLVHENRLSDFGAILSDQLGIVDSYYGSSVYMPVAEGAVYTVTASVSGLVARADNNIAKQAQIKWMSQ